MPARMDMRSPIEMAHLDFEAPLVELEERIAALRELTESGAPEAEAIESQIETMEAQAEDLQRKLYADLDVWKKGFYALGIESLCHEGKGNHNLYALEVARLGPVHQFRMRWRASFIRTSPLKPH